MKLHEDIFNELQSLLRDRMFSKAIYERHFNSLDFYREDRDVEFLISLQFYNNSSKINTLFGVIIFQEVNELLKKFIDFGFSNEMYTLINFDIKLKHFSAIEELNSHFKNPKRDGEVLKEKILDFIDMNIIPFFRQYPDIPSINEKILNRVSEKDYPEWIPGQSTLKILIIMKLCGNPKYEAYKASKEKDYLFFVNQNPSMWQPAYDTFLALVDYLDKECYKNDLKETGI